MRIVLASASPRRALLLRAAGFEFETLAVDVDERVQPGEAPAAYVRRLAAEKSAKAASDVAAGFSRTSSPPEGGHDILSEAGDHIRRGPIIIAADTTVVVDHDILGKPQTDDEAAAMLRRLSGRRHEVLTGVSVRHDSREVGLVESTAVHFSPLSEADIAWYVASGEPRDKAGAYAIQGLASRFIPRIEGSYSNVVGLPIAGVHALVAELLAMRSRPT